MQKAKLSRRVMIDRHFLNYLLSSKRDVAAEYLEKLGKIHSHSEDHILQHNIIFDDCFKHVLKHNKIDSWALIGAMHPKPNQHAGDFHACVIKECIDLASVKPWKVSLLTSVVQVKAYADNDHFKDEGVKESVEFKAEDDALGLIDELYSTLNGLKEKA